MIRTVALALAFLLFPAIPATAEDARPAALVGLARVKRDAGDLSAARRYFDAAHAARPLEMPELLEYFWVLNDVDPRAGIVVGRTLLLAAPAQRDVRDAAIAAAAAAGLEDVVLELALGGQQVEPHSARWPRRIAESFMRSRMPGEAADAYARAVAAADADPRDRVGLAIALEAAGDPVRAAASWRDVPMRITREKPEWVRSRMRATAFGAPAAEAIAALETWVAQHPDDRETRGWLVEKLAAEGHAARALRYVRPLTAGPGAEPWIRREWQLAMASGDRTAAIRALERLAAGGGSPEERWALADLLASAGRYEETAALVRRLATDGACDGRYFGLVDRLPDRLGTDLIVDGLRTSACEAGLQPLRRGIERAVAEGRHQIALELIARMPPEHASGLDALRGKLLLWTGDAAAAVPVLESVLAADPGDVEIRWALVHALRGTSRTNAAWRVAAPLLDRAPITNEEAVVLAELALDAGEPHRVGPLLERVDPADAGLHVARLAELRSRAADALRSAELAESRARASERWAAGDHPSALAAAERVLALSASDAEAWFIKIAATASSRPRAELAAAVRGFRDARLPDTPLAVGLAEHLSGLVRDPSDPVIVSALSLLEDLPAGGNAAAAALARARLHAAANRWADSLASIDTALNVAPGLAPALRLRADVLSWSGRHAEAIRAYEEYLEGSDDLDARRQRARVLGWAGRYEEAALAYAELVRARPGETALAAEAAAKRAFFAARWRTAVDAYREWLAIEPRNAEARFELAESLRAYGDPAAADAELLRLETDYGHRLAAESREQFRRGRRPVVGVVSESRSANGYAGARLLDLRVDGGSLDAAAGAFGGTRLSVHGGRVRASGETEARIGATFSASATSRIRPALELFGGVGTWHLGAAGSSFEARGGAEWRIGDRLTVDAAFERTALFENIGTIDAGLTATGGTAGARFATRSSSVELRAAGHALSDGNERNKLTLSANRTLGGRLQRVRLLAWAEELSFGRSDPAYFSPAHFFRIDGGFEYVHPLAQPRFNGDRHGEFVLGYLVGTDNRGVLYQHPMVRLDVELRRGLALNARGNWIRSTSYDERSFIVGLRLGGVALR